MRSKKLFRSSISFLLVLAFVFTCCFTQVFAKNAIEVSESGDILISEPIDTRSSIENSEETIKNKNSSVQEAVYSGQDDVQVETGVIGSKKINRFIIKYKNENKRNNVLNKMKNKLKTSRSLKNKKFDVVSTELKIEEFITEMKNNKVDGEIDYIQPDYEIVLSSNDTFYASQWGVENNSQEQLGINIDTNVVPAWSETEGEGTVVAIIDTGIDTTHKELEKNIWVNKNEIPDNNIDDDSNGYVDDCAGWNFYDDTNEIHNTEFYSDEGHGTHVAGIIAAEKDNNLGISGIAPKSEIMVLKAFSNGTAYTSDVVEAISYAQKMGAKIVNCSFGSSADNPALREVMANSNMLFVCASGNSHVSIDSEPVYPACFGLDNIITVASIGKTGELSSFSNYGEMNVDVAAPGEDITSTLPGNRFGQKSGTSMATPFVSGEAVLILSKYKDITAQEIKEKIINSSDRISTLDGKVRRANKINIANALSGIVNDDMVEVKAKEVAEESEAANESENTSVNANGEFSTYSGSSMYSDSQEVISSMFSIPATSVNGTLNTVVKGNTRTNLLKSPEMNKDSDGNGVVDNFNLYRDPYYTNNAATDEVIYSFDSAEQCQKVEITKSTSTKGACVQQKFNVSPGDIINAEYDVKIQGDVKTILRVCWLDSNNTWMGCGDIATLTSTGFVRIKNIDRLIPEGAASVSIQMWITPKVAGGTGSVWFKNAYAEKKSSTAFDFTGNNLIKSPNMNTDTDKNGVVDNFAADATEGVTATYSLDLTEGCQKVELTNTSNDTNKLGVRVYQWVDVKPGDRVSMSCQAKVQGNVRVRFYIAWNNGSTYLSGSYDVFYTGTNFGEIRSINSTAPDNATRALVIMRVVPLNTGDTGTAWLKNLVLEKNASGLSMITEGTKSTEPFRVKSVGKNLFSDEMFYNYGTAEVTNGSISINNNRLKFVSTGENAYTNTRSSYTVGTKSPVSYNKYSFPVTASKMYYTRKIENMTEGSTTEHVYYYDSDRRLISYTNIGSTVNGTVTSTLIPPVNAKYFNIRLGAYKSGQTVYFSEFMLSNENIAYEPYKESVAYVPVKLNSLTNGVRDEIDINTGTYIKRTEKVTVGRGAWYNTSFNNYNNYNVYEYKLDATNILPGSIISVNGYDFVYAKGDSADTGYYNNWTDEHQSFTGNNNITLRFPKTYTAPSEVTIAYQLATPALLKSVTIYYSCLLLTPLKKQTVYKLYQ